MTSAMPSLYEIDVMLHASAGGVALVTMALPLVARKGGRLHRVAGWVFVVALAIVAVTGVGISLAWLLDPLGTKLAGHAHAPAEAAQAAAGLRQAGLFFGFLALLVGVAVWNGVVAIRRRRGTLAWGHRVDRACAWALTGGGALLLLAGVAWRAPIFAAFGGLGVVGGVADLRFYRVGRADAQVWLRRHLQAMLGGATAATTAFAVQVVGRMLGETFGAWMLAVWLLPVALGSGLSVWWTRRVEAGRERGYAERRDRHG